MNLHSPGKPPVVDGETLIELEKRLLELQSKCDRCPWSKPNEQRLSSYLKDIEPKINGVKSMMDNLLRIEFDENQYRAWRHALDNMRDFQRYTTCLVDDSRRLLRNLRSAIERRDSAPKNRGIKSAIMDYCSLSDRDLGFTVGDYCALIRFLARQEGTLCKELLAFDDPGIMKVASIAEDARKELMLAAGSITILSGLLVKNRRDGLGGPLSEVALLMEDLKFKAVDKDAATLLSKSQECPWSDLQDDRLLPLLGDMDRRITGLRNRLSEALSRDWEEDEKMGVGEEMAELWAFRSSTNDLACNTSDALRNLIFVIDADELAASNSAILEALSEYRCFLDHMYGPEENALDEKLSAFQYADSIKLRPWARKVRDVIMTVGECIGGVYDRAYDSLGDMALPSGSGAAHDDELLRTFMDSQDTTPLPEEELAYYHVSPFMAANRIIIRDDFANDPGLGDTRLLPSYEELQYWTDGQDADDQLLSSGLRTPIYATGAFPGSRRTSLLPRGGVVNHGDGYYHHEEDERGCHARAYIDGGWHAETGQGNPSMGSPTSPNAPYTSEMHGTWPPWRVEVSFDNRDPHSTSPVYNNHGSSYAYMPIEYNDGFFHSRPLAEFNNGRAGSQVPTGWNQGQFHGYIDGEVFHSDDER
ncbi:hypothetical protein LTR70_007323 [Exophiala xenobiotica]|uniref:Uncharacterized protein n=1 Tax=Lithohypha guttulata TaxID=1690604 RepID=A0ABR0K4G8_9EURO|nr:hypothetical protein LTR24_007093 [Lithohypha guttulata]KAK5314112.1 hypothetical protein LTR70_007323 [Exophiala xenobiotica]